MTATSHRSDDVDQDFLDWLQANHHTNLTRERVSADPNGGETLDESNRVRTIGGDR